MSYKQVLTIQDISCFGQCSLTVALPILSACGVQASVIPSAVLSTHTYKFKDFTFRDLTDDIPKIQEHWIREKICFDAIYTGYLGSIKQVDYVKDVFCSLGNDNCKFIVDPAFADHGELYKLFNNEYVEAIKTLCKEADVLIPNITECCFLTNTEYKEIYNEQYVTDILKKMEVFGAETIIVTGITYNNSSTGVVIYEAGKMTYYKHRKVDRLCHGTGDIYASAFTGALMNNKTSVEAATIAADYTLECILETGDDPSHWYGTKFEKAIPKLIELLELKA